MVDITVDGPPIVAGEVDRTLVFDNLQLDWASAGYTMKLELTDPSGSEEVYALATVSGDVYAAKKVGVEGMFPVSGVYRFQLAGYIGATRKRIGEGFEYHVKEG